MDNSQYRTNNVKGYYYPFSSSDEIVAPYIATLRQSGGLLSECPDGFTIKSTGTFSRAWKTRLDHVLAYQGQEVR